MLVLELCLLPSLLFQDPAAKAPPTEPTPAIVAPPDVVEELQGLETGREPDLAELHHLAQGLDLPIATRATWVLGQVKQPEAFALLCELAQQNTHAEVRLQAINALLRGGQNTATLTALACLDDSDARVRALAAQLLGRLRRPNSSSPLLAMLSRRAGEATADAPTVDLQSAVLALADMGNAELLLPAATAIGDSKAQGVGQALTYYFQTTSPKLAPGAEATTLVAVLDHKEPLLRRYALSRLAELRIASTAEALEARLAKEGKELQPLVEIALAQVRHQDADQGAETAGGPALLWTRIKGRWNELSATEKLMLGGIGGGCLVAIVIGLGIARSRRRTRRAAESSALAMHSAAYLAGVAEESRHLATAADEMLDESAEYEKAEDGAAADENADWADETFEADTAQR